MINDPLGPDAAPVIIEWWGQRLADADRSARLMDTNYRALAQELTRTTVQMHHARRERDLLATRCAEQAHTIAALLAKYEPARAAQVEPHPIHTAVAAMQRGGLR